MPPRPAQGSTLGNVTVFADAFTDTSDGFTASGTIWLGEYTIVENASLSARGGALSGSGLVSMISSADGGRRTLLFRDSFVVNTSNGLLTPQGASGFEFLLPGLAGFAIERDRYDLVLDVIQGRLSGRVNLIIATRRDRKTKLLEFRLEHTGTVNGSLPVAADTTPDLELNYGAVTLLVKKAVLENDGLTLEEAEAVLPLALGGLKAKAPPDVGRITGDGKYIPASVVFWLPNIRVRTGQKSSFGLEGIKATLTITDDEWRFRGKGTLLLPGLGRSQGGCKVSTEFELATGSPPIRGGSLKIEGCLKIPIGTTGFFLTGLRGTVEFDQTTTAIDIGITISSGFELPYFGPALQGDPDAHWDTTWAVGLKGKLKLFKFDLAEAALTLSKVRGLEGTITINMIAVQSQGSLRIWYDSSTFHITGRQEVRLRIESGAIFEECAFDTVCFSIPPTTMDGPRVDADLGEFRVGDERVYGMKGQMELLGYQPAFFIDMEGKVRYDLGGLKEYRLVGLAAVQATTDMRQLTVAPNTAALLVGLAVSSGGPTLSLVTPDGQTLDASSAGVVATTSLTETLLTVSNPPPGLWTVRVDNLDGAQYTVVALGAQPPATISVPVVTAQGDGSYTIEVVGSSVSPTATISLFYDTSPVSRTGVPIVQDLPLTTTSYHWQPTAVPSGTYSIYAMVDDPLGAPAFAYSPTSVTISDSTAPDPPTGLVATSSGSTAYLAWQASSAPDNAGYRIYYREPGGGTTFSADIPDGQQTNYVQQGLYLNGDWEIAISAYDLSGNESARSASVTAQVYLSQNYLPIIQH